MTALPNELASSPTIYPQKWDIVRDALLLIRLTEADYRAASFLDDRILSPATRGEWAPFDVAARAAASVGAARPLHFIFHAGHVGSTLLSRLLDETGSVLSLREPLPLRSLADARDVLGRRESPFTESQLADRLDVFVRLWSRGFPQTRTVVLKATSATGRLGVALLKASQASRAVYLNLPPEPYLATLLGGANAIHDLNGFAPERIRRLGAYLGEHKLVLSALSPGELAAMSWLTERLTQVRTANEVGSRVLALDFEVFLANVDEGLANVCRHFGMTVSPEILSRAARSRVMGRYSKAPEQYEYSPAFRAQILAQARRDHAVEIRKGLSLIELLSRNHQAAASTW
jgi:hypothetical protein